MEIAKIAAIVTTLNETDGAPESMLYIFLDMNMDEWQTMRHLLVSNGLITIKGNYATLTDKGRELAQKLNEALETSRENE